MILALTTADVLSIVGAVFSIASVVLAIWQLWGRKTDMRTRAEPIPGRNSGQGSRMRQLMTPQEAIRSRLASTIRSARRQGRTTIAADDLLAPLFDEFPAEDVHAALAQLRREGIVDWRRSGDWVEEPNVPIDLLPPDGPRQWLAAA